MSATPNRVITPWWNRAHVWRDVAYWYHLGRALTPGFRDRAALRLARCAAGVLFSDTTIRKIAQGQLALLADAEKDNRFRRLDPRVRRQASDDRELCDLSERIAALCGRNVADMRDDARRQISAYREYLRRKSPRTITGGHPRLS